MLIGWSLWSTVAREPVSIRWELEGKSRLRVLRRREQGLGQIMHADAKESDRLPSGVGALEQPTGAADDVPFIARRVFGVTPRNRREVVIADLDRHRACVECAFGQPGRRVARHRGNLAADVLDVGEIVRARILAAGRFWLVCGDTGTVGPPRGPAAPATLPTIRPRRAASPRRLAVRR